MRLPIFALAIITLFGLSQVHAQELNKNQAVNFLSWNEGYPLAKETNKILLIDLYTDWCGWCKRMDRDTYANPEIIDLINKHFVAVKFNPEKTNINYDVEGKTYNGQQLYAMLIQNQRSGFPTTVFIFTKEKTLYLEAGYKDAANFAALLKKYMDIQTGNGN